MPNELTKLKIDMAKAQKDISYTKEKVDGIEKMLVDFIKKADACYARKDRVDRLEKFISKVMWTSIVALLGFLFSIFKDFIIQQLIS